jgi:hypothetical protein
MYTATDTRQPVITIRIAREEDLPALRLVAARDSARLPETPLLVGLVGGEYVAAMSATSGEVVADPFRRTAELVTMLDVRRRQLHGPPQPRGRGWLRALRGYRARGGLAPQPAGGVTTLSRDG